MATIILAKHVPGQLQDVLTKLETDMSNYRYVTGHEYVKRDGTVYRRAEKPGTMKTTYLSCHPLDINHMIGGE